MFRGQWMGREKGREKGRENLGGPGPPNVFPRTAPA